MKKKLKEIVGYLIIFLITLTVFFLLLVAVAGIPKSKIRDNVYESAVFFKEQKIFDEIVDGVRGSTLDRYADTILVGIAFQYDENHPESSVLWSSYYHNDLKNENDNLMKAVTEDLSPNQQYLRYWHGSNVILRPLLIVFNIKQIYVINAVVVGSLILALVILLIKKGNPVPAIGILISFLLTASWFVPFSLEYVWTYEIMLVMSIVAVGLAYKEKWKYMGVLFLIGGMITNYLDFLSTETLTFTVPVLLLIWIKNNTHNTLSLRETLLFTVKMGVLWGIGYIGTWIGKWAISAAYLGQNIMPYVTEHIGERLNGDVGLNTAEFIFGAIKKNIGCLFPFEYGLTGMLAGIALVLFAVYIGYVHYGKKVEKHIITVYVIIAIIPYVRYAVLHNHAYLHCFFTYRAQAATILAVIFILDLMTDRRWFSRGKNRKKRA